MCAMQEEQGGMDDGRSIAPSMMTNAQAEAAQAALQASQQRRRVELTYAAFVDGIFRRLPIAKEDRGKIKPSLLWQVCLRCWGQPCAGVKLDA